MEISEIDEDFIEIIDYLNVNGLKPFASCDGVHSHHSEDEKPIDAYISFLKSESIIKLMSAFLVDNENFSVILTNSSCKEPYELYGNQIFGNTYSVYFFNSIGERTRYFERIIKAIVSGKVDIPNEKIDIIKRISDVLESVDESDLYFQVSLNTPFKQNIEDEPKCSLTIYTKGDIEYERNLSQLAEMISKKFNIQILNGELDSNRVKEYISLKLGETSLFYYFNIEDIERLIEIIKFSYEREDELQKIELEEIEYDDIGFID